MSRSRPLPQVKRDIIRTLLVSKMGIEPGALRCLPPQMAGRYDSQWAPVEELASHLERLPAGMLRFLADHSRGYFLVSTHTGYEPGDITVREHHRSNVVFVDIRGLESLFASIQTASYLVDHLLGCDGEPAGVWLSDGGGMTPELANVGGQIRQLFNLGYAIDEEAGRSRRDYLARSLAWYVVDRRRLNIADPQIERLLKRTLMDDAFWEKLNLTGHRGSSSICI